METDAKYRDRNENATGFETTAGAVENWTQNCNLETMGSREMAAV